MPENKTPSMVTELLKKAVAEKGQSGVARETGLTQPAIHRYLKGIGEPSTRTLKKLEKYFGVTVAELRGDILFHSIPDDLSYIDKILLIAATYVRGFLNRGFKPYDESDYKDLEYIEVIMSLAKIIIETPLPPYSGFDKETLLKMNKEAKELISKYSGHLEKWNNKMKQISLARQKPDNNHDLPKPPDR